MVAVRSLKVRDRRAKRPVERCSHTKANPLGLVAGLCLVVCWSIGCRTTTTMHVWQSPEFAVPHKAAIALGPIAGNRAIAQAMEQAILDQRPVACNDMALFTPEQLIQVNPIRLASTAALNHDSSALVAARAAGADVLLMGEIARTDITAEDLYHVADGATERSKNMNQRGLQRLLGRFGQQEDQRQLLLTWRYVEVSTGRQLGAQSFSIDTRRAEKEFPDLHAMDNNPATRLISAAARESWKGIAPVVAKTPVRLAVPWLQPGSFWVRSGNRAAKRGNWQLAEQRWQGAANWFWFNAPARHNLALAMAAREDFEGAKQMLEKARGPLAVRLPSETLFWMDQHHRLYNAAHGLGEPASGWAIPRADEVQFDLTDAPPIDIDQLPWWTAIPLMKPAELTWQEYWALW
jgi:hypothetical protein